MTNDSMRTGRINAEEIEMILRYCTFLHSQVDGSVESHSKHLSCPTEHACLMQKGLEIEGIKVLRFPPPPRFFAAHSHHERRQCDVM